MELVATTPEVIHACMAAIPERTVKIGGQEHGLRADLRLALCARFGGRTALLHAGRPRTTFHKLAYLTPALHLTGGIICEPVDIAGRQAAPAHRVFRAAPLRQALHGRHHGARAGRGLGGHGQARAFGDDFVEANTVMVSVCNCNSPLVWDATMLDAVKTYARHNQAVVLLSPFVHGRCQHAGQLSVGAVAQLNAEALAGLAFAQLVRRGAPMIYGQFLATVSMRSGAPMAGTPEISMMNFMIGQLARRYRLPWRSSGMVCGAKLTDAQAAYESNMTMQSVLLAGANYVFHAAGWLEAGLTASFAKFVLDCEQMEMYYRYAQGVSLADLNEALAAVREVGPGGHFLGTKHTQDNFQSAFYMPELLDNNSFEQWHAEGAQDTSARGLVKAREMLERYDESAPELDPAVDEELQAFIRQREAVLPDTVS